MPTPTAHAKAGASSAHRWLNCTASPTFEAQFPQTTSKYAEEGTLAHEFCEAVGRYNAHLITKPEFEKRWEALRQDPLYDPEMEKTAEFYQRYLFEKEMTFKTKPHVAFEVRVDFGDYVPDGFGTCDCVMIGDDRLHITDYKHGKGVPVSSENNPQMRLYALGALKQYGMFYSVRTVSMAIVQPRVSEEVSEEEISVEELLRWGELIRPIAEMAVTGVGASFHEGPWCRFCRGKAVCRARAENMTALEDFRDIPIEGRLTDDQKALREAVAAMGQTPSGVLTDAEIGDLLKRGEELVSWYNDLKDYAMETLLAGGEVPGWKIVEGRSIRSFADTDKAFDMLRSAGWQDAMLYERKPKTLAELEKMVGKKEFAKLLADQIVKPPGKPALAAQSDKRPVYTPAVMDFREAAG